MADIVRGYIIPPDGGVFDLNEVVGPRTIENGFVLAGAIENGEHVESVGGGVSQFATTSFNAAFFAGLDIPDYQFHTEHLSRYPFGRESTVSYGGPEFRIVNNTPYGVLMWPTYTETSITMHLYSTRFATGAQTGQSTGTNGSCTTVTTTRTRTYVDGHTEQRPVLRLLPQLRPDLRCDFGSATGGCRPGLIERLTARRSRCAHRPVTRLAVLRLTGAVTDEHFDFQPRMSDADKLMWTIERDPLLRSTITSVVVLDSAPDHDRLREKLERASRTVVRLRQRVIGNALSFSPPRWEVDPNFDLDYHLRIVNARQRRLDARAVRHRRADRDAGLRPGPPAVGVHRWSRAWRTGGPA